MTTKRKYPEIQRNIFTYYTQTPFIINKYTFIIISPLLLLVILLGLVMLLLPPWSPTFFLGKHDSVCIFGSN